MPLAQFQSFLTGPQSALFFGTAGLGALAGCLLGGLATVLVSHVFARRLFKSQVLDHARRDINGPLSAYQEWLTTVSGEFALWKSELLSAFISDSVHDQFELNRMRKLFVDQRNVLWLSKLEEYDTLLGKFNPAIKAMWIRQMDLHDNFSRIFKNLEADPNQAVKAGERIESLAFEQGQLVSDFLYHLQYECLRSIATAKPRSPKIIIKPRIIRTTLGRIRLVTPKNIDTIKL